YRDQARGKMGKRDQRVDGEADLAQQAPLRMSFGAQRARHGQALGPVAEPIDEQEDRRVLFVDAVDGVHQLAVEQAEIVAERREVLEGEALDQAPVDAGNGPMPASL